MKPVVCTKCGNEIDFERRLFQIKGVAKRKRSDDEIQNVIESHFKQNYSIDHIFFKSIGSKFLVDTATCSNCQSTAITYDIDFDLISMIERTTEKPEL
jgi:DNA-directed RNA polymerase subunit M/transcription elongation factor TFIIS